jgi:hypothetical protein
MAPVWTSLSAGKSDRLFDLGPVEHLAVTVGLDHGDLAQLDAFKGGETRATAFALAATADRSVVFGGARILYLTVIMRAERAPQGRSLL